MEAKISLSLQVPGAQRLTQEVCESNPKTSYDTAKLSLEYTEGKGKSLKVKREILVVKTPKQRMITQHINLSKEAYDYMMTTAPVDDKKLIRAWKSMSIREKLKEHFDRIAYDLKARSYSYEILDD